MRLQTIVELGTRLELAWKRVNYDLAALPMIAAEGLDQARLPSLVSPTEIARHVLLDDCIEFQWDLEARFGQPPVTLYRGSRLYIEALHWVDASTTIHQHAFSGAFLVLQGSSIESRYHFVPERGLDGHFCFGDLQPLSINLNGVGSVCPIVSGPAGLIHSLFHLERPSLTIVVRSMHDATAGAQFTYTRNGIGIDPFYRNSEIERAVQIVHLLRQTAHREFESLIGEAVARSDLHKAYRLLGACRAISDRDLFERLIQRVSDPTAQIRFREAFAEADRIDHLYARRALVHHDGPRFLLGILLNARSRRDVIDLARQRMPDAEPERQIAAWLKELSRITLKLQAGGGAWEPNILGLPEIDDDGERSIARALKGETAPDERSRRLVATLRRFPALACLFN